MVSELKGNLEEAQEWSHHQEMKFSTILYRNSRKIDFSLFEHLLGKSMKILDLGCNGSYVVKELLDRGHDAYGADLPAVIERALWDYPELGSRLFGCNLDTGNEIPVEKDYDLVLCLGVIEHLVNYDELLPKIYNILKPRGKVLVTTCNRHQIQIERHHYHHFTPLELDTLACRAKLKVVKISFPSRTSLVGEFQK